jgi:predicted dehydrogenase
MRKKVYGLSEARSAAPMAAPKLAYQPPLPRRYRPKLALIGCGGIAACHLQNYRAMGLQVAVLCDHNRARAEERAREFYPDAFVTTDYAVAVARDDIEVVDIATDPAKRVPVIRAALEARKHVLSQKPFVTDLQAGRELARLADRQGVRLAVNQNGRWSPHWSYLTQLVRAGTLGELSSIDFTVAWDHSWVKSTRFNTIHHLVLYDFALHWFDIATVWMAERRANSVFARVTKASIQPFDPPALVSVVADYGNAQVRWNFNAANRFAQCDRTLICGSKGTALSAGPSLSDQTVTLTTARGVAEPELEGTWFESGFQGAMGELLCAIEENREPTHSARNNLASLELALAALASAERGKSVRPGTVTRLTRRLLSKCSPGKAQTQCK